MGSASFKKGEGKCNGVALMSEAEFDEWVSNHETVSMQIEITVHE